jgi:hypothetical protein
MVVSGGGCRALIGVEFNEQEGSYCAGSGGGGSSKGRREWKLGIEMASGRRGATGAGGVKSGRVSGRAEERSRDKKIYDREGFWGKASKRKMKVGWGQ